MGKVRNEDPDLVYQSLPGLTEQQRKSWLQGKIDAAAKEGMTWPRFTWDENRKIMLLECWRERPLDEGAPRWQS